MTYKLVNPYRDLVIECNPFDRLYTLSVMLPVEANSGKWHHTGEMSLNEVLSVLVDWTDNPEACFAKHFGWIRPGERQKITLKDLELYHD